MQWDNTQNAGFTKGIPVAARSGELQHAQRRQRAEGSVLDPGVLPEPAEAAAYEPRVAGWRLTLP